MGLNASHRQARSEMQIAAVDADSERAAEVVNLHVARPPGQVRWSGEFRTVKVPQRHTYFARYRFHTEVGPWASEAQRFGNLSQLDGSVVGPVHADGSGDVF